MKKLLLSVLFAALISCTTEKPCICKFAKFEKTVTDKQGEVGSYYFTIDQPINCDTKLPLSSPRTYKFVECVQ